MIESRKFINLARFGDKLIKTISSDKVYRDATRKE